MAKIDDFGEKIGGARKDLYALNRELRLEDIADWSEYDREKYITKKEAFPLPDYKKLYEQGINREVLFYIKEIRDALPTKPSVYIPHKSSPEEKQQLMHKAQEDYINTIGKFYEHAMDLKTISDCMNFYEKIKAENIPAIDWLSNRKLLNVVRLDSYGYHSLLTRMRKKQFLYSDEEKILSNYTIFQYDGSNVEKEIDDRQRERLVIKQGGSRYFIYHSNQDPSKWNPNTYFAIDSRTHQIKMANMEDVEQLKKTIVDSEENVTKDKNITRKKKLVPAQLSNIRPTAEDYRGGKNITGEDMLNTFQFHGGEFGNWENDLDRQTNLNMSFDALNDLVKALGIEHTDISLGGGLSIAYGARGVSNAAAHFEPGMNVINLTKMKGAGSLAHEWGHALDHYIAMQNGDGIGFATEKPKGKMKELMNIIKYNESGQTEYYQNAKLLDLSYGKSGHKGYWQSDVELFARAFASYVRDKLEPDASDYLVGHSEMSGLVEKDGKLVSILISPQGEERRRINEAIDAVIEDLKEEKILHHVMHTKEQEQSIQIYEEIVSDMVVVPMQNQEELRDTTETDVKQEMIVKLTGQPVSKEMQDILKRLSEKQYVSLEEINATKEMKIARSNINYACPTIQLDNRQEIQLDVLKQMNQMGSVEFDENGKVIVDSEGNTLYNGRVERNSRLDIVIGLPASGKSSAIANSISNEFHSKVIDNDEAKKKIPQYNDGWGSGVVHEESQYISDAAFRMAVQNHENIVLPKVGSKAEKLCDSYIIYAKENGYEVNLHYVELDRNIALGRMINRFIEDGRFLEPNLIEKYDNPTDGNRIETAYETVKLHSSVAGYSKWDNDVERGEQPILLESHNLTGNYIKNARRKVNYMKGVIGNERRNERNAKISTIDSRNYRESGRDEPEGGIEDERGQRGYYTQHESGRSATSNEQVLQVADEQIHQTMPNIIKSIEEKIRNQKYETLVVVSSDDSVLLIKDGDERGVELTDDERTKMEGATLIHNHPNGNRLSDGDIKTFMHTRAKEIRVVTDDGLTCSLKVKDEAIQQGEKFILDYFKLPVTYAHELNDFLDKRIEIDGLDPDGEKACSHEYYESVRREFSANWLKDNALKYGYEYYEIKEAVEISIEDTFSTASSVREEDVLMDEKRNLQVGDLLRVDEDDYRIITDIQNSELGMVYNYEEYADEAFQVFVQINSGWSEDLKRTPYEKIGYVTVDENHNNIISTNRMENYKFKNNVYDFFNNNKVGEIVIDKTPNSLAMVGADKTLKLGILPKTLIKCNKSPTEKHHGHELDVETLQKILEQIRNPVMILQGSYEHTVIIVSDIKNKNNENIIISVQLNKEYKHHMINNISSAYGKEDFKGYLERQISEGKMLAVNINKANEMLQSLGLSLPPEETFISFTNNITYSMDNVKYPTKNQLERTKTSGLEETLDVQENDEQYQEFSVAHQEFIVNKEVSRIPVVINAFGGPGSGKSVSCMDICQQLKKLGYNAEYVQEYAKDLVYDENWEMLDGSPENQFEVLKEQLRRMDRLYGTVDFIVTDSPVLLNSVYNKSLTPQYDNMVTSLYKDFENFTYFVERDTSSYQQEGRIQNLEESQKIDEEIKQLLAEKDVYYGTYNHDTINKIVSNSIKTFNRINHVDEEATAKQVAYAEKIATTLNIDLPKENTKEAYRFFISEYQKAFANSNVKLSEVSPDINNTPNDTSSEKNLEEQIDKEKSQDSLMFQGLQLPKAFNNPDSNEIVEQSSNIVNQNIVTLPENLVDEEERKKIDEEFVQEVHDWKSLAQSVFASDKGISHMLKVCRSSKIMQICGAENFDVYMAQTTMLNTIAPENQPYGNHSQGHELIEEDVYNIPYQLNNPSYVILNNKKDSLVFVTDRNDYKDRRIIISVALDRKNGRMNINQVTSMYGRKNFENYLNTNIKEGNLIAYNTKKANELHWSQRVQFPKENVIISFDNNIPYLKEEVKNQIIAGTYTMNSSEALKEIASTVENIYQSYLEKVSQNGNLLKDVPEEYHTEELLLAAVSNWGAAIRNVPAEKLTSTIVMTSVTQYGTNLRHVPKEMRSEAVCIAAYVNSAGKAIRYIPSEIKDVVKAKAQEILANNNTSIPVSKRELEVEQVQEQGREWATQISNMLREHETDPEAMVEDIISASKFYQYSVKNIQIMRRQNPGMTFVASASSFEQMGYHVNNGEKAMIARVPSFSKYVIDENGEYIYASKYTPEIKNKIKQGVLKEHEKITRYVFRPALYDISQTDCPVENYPSMFYMGVPSELHQEAFNAMKEFAEDSLGFKVMTVDLKSISLRGNCEPDNKIIRVNDKLESTMALSTLCHEIAYGIIHTLKESEKMTTAQKECEADVMAIMLESSLGLAISESRREHLYHAFHTYKDEQAAKEHPYEVTLEKLIDRVQKKVFRPYAEDIKYYLALHLPADGVENDNVARNLVKDMALFDSAYQLHFNLSIDPEHELFAEDKIELYRTLYQQTKEEYRLGNSFVPKLAVIKDFGKDETFLTSVQFIDKETVDTIKNLSAHVTQEYLPLQIELGDVLAIKENVLEDSQLYIVTEQGLQPLSDKLNQELENKINCGFDVSTEYQCIRNLLQNNIEILSDTIPEYYNHICERFGYTKDVAQTTSNQFMARINLITEGMSSNDKELIAEYVFRTGNYQKAEKYAEKLQKEPGISKQLLQEMRLIDSYKYMLWTIADYEDAHSVSGEKRITTGAYNNASIPLLSENAHSLSQINECFLEIKKHNAPESVKYYSIVTEEEGYRIGYVELDDYVPSIKYSTGVYSSYEEAKEFYNLYLETANSHLVAAAQANHLVDLEKEANLIALSDVTAIGNTIADEKYRFKELGVTENDLLNLLRDKIDNYQDVNSIHTLDASVQILKDFKQTINDFGEKHFVELCNLDDFSDINVMEESLQVANWLSKQREVIANCGQNGIEDVTQLIDMAMDSCVTTADLEQAYNAIDAVVLNSEYSNLKAHFDGYEDYNSAFDTLKSSFVTADKFCYIDYKADDIPMLYTSDPAGNVYKKSLRNEWTDSVQEMYGKLQKAGYEVCSNFDDFKAYAMNNRLAVPGAPERKKEGVYVRVIESTSDLLTKGQTLSVYDFKNHMDKIYSGSSEANNCVTYKLVTRNNQEIQSYIDTYSGDVNMNVYEKLYDKVKEQSPELCKLIGKQYYQDVIDFSERHLMKPLLEQLKEQGKTEIDSKELQNLTNSCDKLKEVIKELDLSPAEAEILKLNVGSMQVGQVADIQRQMQLQQNQQLQKQRNKQNEGISLV